MPWSVKRVCAAPGCSTLVSKGRCPAHTKSRHERGYDSRWVRLRDWFMRQPENALCRRCETEDGRVTIATDADHIVPFDGPNDPKRLDPDNLQPSCRYHNLQKVRKHG